MKSLYDVAVYSVYNILDIQDYIYQATDAISEIFVEIINDFSRFYTIKKITLMVIFVVFMTLRWEESFNRHALTDKFHRVFLLPSCYVVNIR